MLVNRVIERWVERGKQADVSHTCKADISCPAVKTILMLFFPLYKSFAFVC